jgi:hypothetical protein
LLLALNANEKSPGEIRPWLVLVVAEDRCPSRSD